MNVLNSSIVGLTIDESLRTDASDLTFITSNTSTSNCNCVGLGIIRAIDPLLKIFYILTPVSKTLLEKVNVLMHGDIPIPITMLLQGYPGYTVPYTTVMETEGQGASHMKTKHLGRKKYINR